MENRDSIFIAPASDEASDPLYDAMFHVKHPEHFRMAAPRQAKQSNKPQIGTRGLVVHGAWAPTGATSRTFAIWAEVENTVRPRRRVMDETAEGASASHPLPERPRSHPFNAHADELSELFARLWKTARPGAKPRTRYDERRLTLWLPSLATRPYPAPELITNNWAVDPTTVGYTVTEAPLQLWRVNACFIDAEAAGALLVGLPYHAGATLANAVDEDGAPLPTVRLGADLRYWAAAAIFAHDLLARQRYLPGVREIPAPAYYSGYGGPQATGMWYAALGEADVRVRFDALAEAMPGLCRAAIFDAAPTGPSSMMGPRPLLESFVNAVINDRIVHWARSNGVKIEVPRKQDDRAYIYSPYAMYGGLGERWLRSLLTPNQPLYLSHDEAKMLLAQGNRWHAGASSSTTALFRLCFRISPPEAPDEAPTTAASSDVVDDAQDHSSVAEVRPAVQTTTAQAATSDDATPEQPERRDASLLIVDATSSDASAPAWRLDYLLQANDDLSLLVPLDEVWGTRENVTRIMGRRFERPHEFALASLAQAGRVCPPIERSLAQMRPTGCELTGAEAYLFLRESLPRLEEAGFGVLAPAWWKRAPVKPSLKLRVRNSQQTSLGLMGLDAVVAFDWKVALGGQELTREELEQLAALKAPLIRLRGQWVELQSKDVEAALRFMRKRGGQMGVGEALRVSLTGELDGANVTVDDTVADGWIGDLLGRLRSGETFDTLTQPETLHGTLRPYQGRGMSWLNFLTRYGLGACLADDMGLGKSIEMLACLLHQKAAGQLTRPVLLVCPTSVVGNWEHEVARFAPGLRLLVHHGAGRMGRADAKRFADEAPNYDLVITTYSLLPRDEAALADIPWGGVVLDEAQNIKNADAKQSRSARKLHAPMRVALTGTPVENRLAELWSIMDFLNPGYLGSHKHFHEQFALQIERGHDAEVTAQLQTLTRPFILRRLKTDPTIIQDLPEKVEIKEYCSLTREQVTLYEAVVRDGLRQLEDAATPMQRRGIVLALLTRLKQVCNHPAHYLGDDSVLKGRSGKLTRLEELIEELLAEGDRALIFTQYTTFGARLQPYLSERFGVETLYLHGGTPQKERVRLVDRFQSEDGPPLFLLSLKAGGVGLNLTAATHVIHFDRWWNPAVETQATDRAHRIGQTRRVQARKLICSGTLEERIDTLIDQKRDLAENVIGGGEGWLTELSTTQLRDLFSLRADAIEE